MSGLYCILRYQSQTQVGQKNGKYPVLSSYHKSNQLAIARPPLKVLLIIERHFYQKICYNLTLCKTTKTLQSNHKKLSYVWRNISGWQWYSVLAKKPGTLPETTT